MLFFGGSNPPHSIKKKYKKGGSSPMTNNNYLGNGTTIGKFLLIMIAGRTIAILAAQGIQLPINDYELAGYIGIIAGFLYSILDSYYKNNLKWTRVKSILNIFNEQTNEEIIDIDPASEYETLNEYTTGDVDDGC